MRKVLAVFVAVSAACASPSQRFSAEDDAAVRALEEAYRSGWAANDSSAVMATLGRGAVLMPAGLEPIRGDSAIRAFWWPNDGSTTTIESYELTVEEVQGSADLAYVRGRGSLAFIYRSADGEETSLTSEAVHLSVASRGEGGEWRIASRAWSAIR